MSLLALLTGRTPKEAPQLAARSDPSLSEPPAPQQSSPYPAADPGIEALSVDAILAANQEFIDRIKLCYGSDRATFEKDLLVPIRNYANFVNLLPATADNFFCNAGGLFRLGLEAAFYALQGTDGHIVSGRATISTRRHLEPRWRQATFLAGLCAELHRTLSHIVVTDEKGEAWPSFLQPLTAWHQSKKSRRFFIRWLSTVQESRALGLFALPHVVPAEIMQHLAKGNNIAVPHLLSCLAGSTLYRDQNVLVELVNRSTALVIDRDLIASSHRYGRPILGAHLERYLIDAMRRLVATDDRWAPNQERSRVWLGQDGLYIVWPNAAAEIRQLLEEDELPGIPKSPETIAEILLSAGVLSARAADQPLWQICPPPGKTVLEAIKLTSPGILLSTDDGLKPIEASIAHTPLKATPRQEPTAAAAASVGSPQASPSTSPPSLPQGATPQLLCTSDGEIVTPYASAASDPIQPPSQQEAVPAASTADTAAPAPEPFRLAAPMRLVPQVRAALDIAIQSLNGSAKDAQAITIATGIFIPLDFFKSQQVDIPIALRSLSDCSMVLVDTRGRAKTPQHEFRGKDELGIVLKPTFVLGLDPQHFASDQ